MSECGLVQGTLERIRRVRSRTYKLRERDVQVREMKTCRKMGEKRREKETGAEISVCRVTKDTKADCSVRQPTYPTGGHQTSTCLSLGQERWRPVSLAPKSKGAAKKQRARERWHQQGMSATRVRRSGVGRAPSGNSKAHPET